MGGSLALLGSASVSLDGLEAGQRYYYRFVAQSEGGEGPVYGKDQSFLTYRTPSSDTSCANQALRIGPAADLPDCRAYEMLSPGGEERRRHRRAANTRGSDRPATSASTRAPPTAKRSPTAPAPPSAAPQAAR